MMTGNFVAHDALVVLEITLELGRNFTGCVEDHQNIITFRLIIDHVCETALAPLVYLFDFAAVGGDDTAELIDYGCIILLIKIGHDNIQAFVLIHLIHLLMDIWPRKTAEQGCWHNIITFSEVDCNKFFQ